MKILILSAHVDDAELGMGGTIAKMVAEKEHDITMIAFSAADDSLPKGMPKDTLKKETFNATLKLGFILRWEPIILDFRTRYFPNYRQGILEELIKMRDKYDPDVVYCPSFDDMHQDHQTLAREVMRAFKYKTILMYQMPWNTLNLKLQYFSILKERHVIAKTKALAEFKSQKDKRYMRHNSIVSMASFYGLAIDTDFAEAFEVVRYIDG